MTGRPKRHHYLPQNYLEGFCRDGKLWVHDREAKTSLLQTPLNTAVKNHYYRLGSLLGQQLSAPVSIGGFSSESGMMSPHPLQDPKRVDDYRRSVGLGPLSEKAEEMRLRAAAEGHEYPRNFQKRQKEKEAWARSVGWR